MTDQPFRILPAVTPENEKGKRRDILVPPVPNVLDKSLLGWKLAANGSVAEESTTFAPGQPIALTIWLKQSPPGLTTHAVWYAEGDKVVAREQRAMYGTKMTTFRCQEKLTPGKYRVEGYWGGNVVADKQFIILGGKK